MTASDEYPLGARTARSRGDDQDQKRNPLTSVKPAMSEDRSRATAADPRVRPADQPSMGITRR
jgi:hypothetical protein